MCYFQGRRNSNGKQSNGTNKCFRITSFTLAEFQEKLFNTPKQEIECIEQVFRKCENWKYLANVPRFPAVGHLTLSGCISWIPIVNVLTSLPNITTLVYKSSHVNLGCNQSYGHALTEYVPNTRKFPLTKLVSLSLENFEPCVESLEILNTNFIFTSIKRLVLLNSTFTELNVKTLKIFLKEIRFTISNIRLSDARFAVPLFENFTVVLSKVHSLYIDFPKKLNYNPNLFGSNFKKIFPEVRNMILHGEPLEWPQYIEILKLITIEHLIIEVNVPVNVVFSVGQLVSNLTALKSGVISLRFSDTERCIVNGSNSRLVIRPLNCRIVQT